MKRSVLSVLGTLFIFFLVIPSVHASSTQDSQDTDQRLEEIRSELDAGEIQFKDPNWVEEVGRVLADLDTKIAYFESIKQYYTEQQYQAVLSRLKGNYLHKLEDMLQYRLPTPGQGGGSGDVDPGTGSSKRIVFTQKDGTKYMWSYTPSTEGDSPQLTYDGRQNKGGEGKKSD